MNPTRKVRVRLVVIVYDREKNLKNWLRLWPLIKRDHAALTIIHNQDSAENAAKFEKLCTAASVQYIGRKNYGFDIGALQDVSKERLPGFDYDYDFLLWFTDDVFPLQSDIIDLYLAPFANTSVGAVGAEISSEVRLHLRTTGFCLPKTFVTSLRFPADPIASKAQCYLFEHLSPDNLHRQITQRGKTVVQLAPVSTSPVWDSGHARHKWRGDELKRFCPGVELDEPFVLIFATAFERPAVVASAFIAQSFTNWKLIIEHDGEPPKGWAEQIPKDEKIYVKRTPARRGEYGHPLRKDFLTRLKNGEHGDPAFVLITNEDNYYAPVFLEKTVSVLRENPQAVAAYCAKMVHSYRAWNIIDCTTRRGYLDMGGVLLRKSAAVAADWPGNEHSADWFWFEKISLACGGWEKWVRVPGALFVHN